MQGLSLMKLYFHPGTDMAQAMAETIAYVNRARAFMPPGTVSPFVMRFDTGSVPVGQLVFSSDTRSIREIQDLALNRVRPMFASLPGVFRAAAFGDGGKRLCLLAQLRILGIDSLRRLSPPHLLPRPDQIPYGFPIASNELPRVYTPDGQDICANGTKAVRAITVMDFNRFRRI